MDIKLGQVWELNDVGWANKSFCCIHPPIGIVVNLLYSRYHKDRLLLENLDGKKSRAILNEEFIKYYNLKAEPQQVQVLGLMIAGIKFVKVSETILRKVFE